MINAMGMFGLGLFLLLLGGDSVIRGASGLAQRLGLSPFAAGLLLVAVATSVPALAVNGFAFAHGQTDLALGNVIGSNIANIGLVLALAALIAPLLVNLRLLAAELVFVLVATGAVLMFGADGTIGRWEGGVLLAGFVGVLVFVFRRSRDESTEVQKEFAAFALTSTGLVQNLIRFGFAAALLYFGSKLVVESAPVIGMAFGMDSLLTGLTIVAVGSALPHLVTVAMAARNGQGNVVAGHVLGACLFNLLVVIGGMAMLRPLPVPASLPSLPVPLAMGFALLLWPILGGVVKIERRHGGWLLIAFALWVGFELCLAYFG